ncbi:hypothetical protein [Jeongeupia naejangsanensis]|uniref:Uncharacterized protein n=1 Tax=Jeongeupia naejangsanensis TaxID=613195 RepID=A0ABS2BNK4_9NEIS|nr:hypothetical protein [Jeongeupia naejangsanensis]MBM3117206.1 hypothetical protein [Jeongeupia naejangsanensis]
MRTSKLAIAATLLAFAQFASAQAMPMQRSINLHPSAHSQTAQSTQVSSVDGRVQNQRLHELAGPGSMAG